MAFSFSWYWYNTATSAWVPFSAGNLIGFYGTTTYDSLVYVGNYNQGMHLRTSIGVDTQADVANYMTGLQYLTGSTVSINGGGSVALNTVTDQQAIQLTFTDGATSISTENASFWAYDGTTPANAPVGVTVYGAEVGNTNWVQCNGSASAAPLAAQATPAITHNFYLLMTASPTSVGQKTNFAWEITVDYY